MQNSSQKISFENFSVNYELTLLIFLYIFFQWFLFLISSLLTFLLLFIVHKLIFFKLFSSLFIHTVLFTHSFISRLKDFHTSLLPTHTIASNLCVRTQNSDTNPIPTLVCILDLNFFLIRYNCGKFSLCACTLSLSHLNFSLIFTNRNWRREKFASAFRISIALVQCICEGKIFSSFIA